MKFRLHILLLIIYINYYWCESNVHPYSWRVWNPSDFGLTVEKERTYGGISARHIIGDQPLYVSITAIRSRLKYVVGVIRSILDGLLIPTHIYLVLSEDSYMLDKGVKPKFIPLELQYLAASTEIFSIVFTENIGPHRKLLPILKYFWRTDCVIVTFDDDRPIAKDTLFRLVNHYLEGDQQSVVGLRARRIGFCTDDAEVTIRDKRTTSGRDARTSPTERTAQQHSISPTHHISDNPSVDGNSSTDTNRSLTKVVIHRASSWSIIDYGFCRWPRVQNSKSEMLVLPTGNGGVLYRPRFFHEVVFDPALRNLTRYNDDLTFRLGTLAKGVAVINGCCERLDRCSGTTQSQSIIGTTPGNLGRNRPGHSDMSFTRSLLVGKEAVPTVINMNMTGQTDLYSKNQYLNTDMFLAGLAYLRDKGIINISQLFGVESILHDRPECFHVVKNRRTLKAATSSTSGTSSSSSGRERYILKLKRQCGLLHQCGYTHDS